MSRNQNKKANHYWVLILQGEPEGRIFTSWVECEEERNRASKEILPSGISRASRVTCRGFPTEDEAREFMNGTWKRESITGAAGRWLKAYKTKPGQLQPDTELDISKLSSYEYPKYCAYVGGSYDAENQTYGFGVVLMCDGKIEKLYGGGKEKALANKEIGAAELLACIEAIKYAETIKLPELTIIYDNELIKWAYCEGGRDMLTQAAGQYIAGIRKKMKIEVESIKGRVRKGGMVPADKAANSLAGKLAKKGADSLAGKLA